MEIIAKRSKIKIDPKHPESTDPTYAAAVEKGKKNFPKMKFENETQKQDYLKAVKSNPGNVVGMPLFFPPLSTGTFTGFSGIDVEKKDMLPCGKKWIHASYDNKGNGTYKCFGCNCQGYKEPDLTVDKSVNIT
jgi:hypothetical protein